LIGIEIFAVNFVISRSSPKSEGPK